LPKWRIAIRMERQLDHSELLFPGYLHVDFGRTYREHGDGDSIQQQATRDLLRRLRERSVEPGERPRRKFYVRIDVWSPRDDRLRSRGNSAIQRKLHDPSQRCSEKGGVAGTAQRAGRR